MSAKQKNEAIEKVKPSGGLTQMSVSQQGPREGFENLERRDLIVPRIQICHAQTPHRNKKNENFIEGLKEGQMFNTMSREIYGGKIRVVVVHHYKTRIKFHSKKIGEGIDCRADDGKNGRGDPGGLCVKCGFSMFQGKEPPLCTEFYNFVVVVMPDKGFPSIDNMAVMSFKSTGITAAKNWLTRMNLLVDEHKVGMPIFGGLHDVTVAEQSDAENSWFGFNPQPAGRTTMEQREFARMIYLMVREAAQTGRLQAQEEIPPQREPGEDDIEGSSEEEEEPEPEPEPAPARGRSRGGPKAPF
jgi:hypothetical protein